MFEVLEKTLFLNNEFLVTWIARQVEITLLKADI